MNTTTTKVALLGVGLMGLPMGANILAAGYSLKAWNRSAEKTARLAPLGAEVCGSVAEAISGADIIISMLSDGFTVLEIIHQKHVQDALGAGALWVDMSSTKPAHAREISADLDAFGVGFLDAPVSGGTKGAEAGTLAIMVGGAQSDVERAAGVLGSMGRPVRVGPTGSGQLAKLANQSIVAITIGAVAEATLLLEAGGADANAVRDALSGGFADSTILQQHGARMTERNFVPGGLSSLQVKDLNNVQEEAASNGVNLPMVDQVTERFYNYVNDMSGGDRDHSGLYEELLARNGRLDK